MAPCGLMIENCNLEQMDLECGNTWTATVQNKRKCKIKTDTNDGHQKCKKMQVQKKPVRIFVQFT